MILPPRNYFYKDENGDIKKFAYCCVCGAGPFKESEKNYRYISLHGRSANTYCINCVKTLGIHTEEIIDKGSYAEKEKVEEYSFGEFAKSYIDPYIDIPRLPAGHKKETKVEIKELIPEATKEKVGVVEQIPLPPQVIDPPVLPVGHEKEILLEKVEVKEPLPEAIQEKVEVIEQPPLPPPVIEDEPGPYYVYVGQLSDGVFITGVTTDLRKDFEAINSGQSSRIRTLPMEIVYYHIEQNKKDALIAKANIMSMTPFQKEILVGDFEKKFFEK